MSSITSTVQFRSGTETLAGLFLNSNKEDTPIILFIHGAGKSGKDRAQPLARRLLEAGVSSFAFDFSGHGDSTGKLEESSLEKRTQEAKAALMYIKTLVPTRRPISLCAFSMGGHISIELLKTGAVQNLVLFYPAIYTHEAYDIPFTAQFSTIIRTENSWRKATVVNNLRRFSGKLLLFIGEHDEVIPRGVIDMIDESSTRTKRKEIVIVPNAKHQLLEVIYRSPKLMQTIIGKILEYTT